MKRYLLPALLLSAFFVAGRFWSELGVHAVGRGSGGAFGGNGDVNCDGNRDISDAIYLISSLFLGGPQPCACADGGDHTHTADQLEALSHLRMVDLPKGNGETVRTIQIFGVNLQIVNGKGGTPDGNGLGNLIVGYQELREAGNLRTGSHNIVVGVRHNYSSTGGFIGGYENTISGYCAHIGGGAGNEAIGGEASISGGYLNKASGYISSVIGGQGNMASGHYSTVCGGQNRTASADYQVIADGVGGGGGGLPDTGQTTSYASGDDGAYQTGCPSEGRFVDNGDGTVTDTCTGLMWQKETPPGTRDWQQAINYCANLNLANYDDWRLPNIRELQSIVDYGRFNPAIDPVFGAESAAYWSSSSKEGDTGYAWFVLFHIGYVNAGDKDISDYLYVRAVRTVP